MERTTRVVKPTLDGEAYYHRCVTILDDIEDAEGAFSGALPKGMLRIEVQGTLARHFLMPGLPEFLASANPVDPLPQQQHWNQTSPNHGRGRATHDQMPDA